MRYRFMTLLTALVLAAGGVRLMAQETTGAVTGRITDPQGLAVPGVTVTLTGPQGTKMVVTDGEGRFNAPLLVPGTYAVKAELVGFKTVQQSNVIVRLGQSIEVMLKMDVGGVAETIEVNATSPIIDTRSTTVGAVLDSDTLANIPIGRRFSDTLYIAPGVTSSGSAGRSNPSMAGGSGLDNQYVVDGVNITNAGYGALGSYSIIFGSLGNGTPYDFIKEVQVKTGGYEAEYGQAIGGVVNVVTKSGTNLMRGSAFGYSRPQGLEGNWKQYESKNGTVQTLGSDLSDLGGTIGGPIMKDKLFYFGDRSELGHSDLPGAEQQGLRWQLPVSPLHAGRHRPQTPDHVVLGEGHLQLVVEPALRRVVLRGPGPRRQWSPAGLCPAGTGHCAVQRVEQVRRQQPDGQL